MEFGVLLVLALIAVGLGAFWTSGVRQGDLRMLHRP